MFREIGVIFEKEMHRVFSDRRLITSTFVLPFVSIFIMYSIMGTMVNQLVDDIESHTPIIHIYNAPESFMESLDGRIPGEEGTYKAIRVESEDELERIKSKIITGDADLLVVFDEAFDQRLKENAEGIAPPAIQTYYNPSEDYSAKARHDIIAPILEAYRFEILSERLGGEERAKVFVVDPDAKAGRLVDEKKATGKDLGNLMPFLITLFLFSGAMNLGMESIAGEKERGTLATTLVTPIRRDSIAFGKIISLSALSLLSSLSSFAGIMASLPFAQKLFTGNNGASAEGGVVALPFGLSEYAMLLGVMMVMVLIFVAIVCVVSLYANSMKEAGTYATPIYMVVMVIGILTMFSKDSVPFWAYFVPVYGSIMSLKSIFLMEYSLVAFMVTMGMSFATIFVLVFLCKSMFNNERVIFHQ